MGVDDAGLGVIVMVDGWRRGPGAGVQGHGLGVGFGVSVDMLRQSTVVDV